MDNNNIKLSNFVVDSDIDNINIFKYAVYNKLINLIRIIILNLLAYFKYKVFILYKNSFI